jgi:hypothetical protein
MQKTQFQAKAAVSKLRITLKKIEPSQQTVSAKSARLLTCG